MSVLKLQHAEDFIQEQREANVAGHASETANRIALEAERIEQAANAAYRALVFEAVESGRCPDDEKLMKALAGCGRTAAQFARDVATAENRKQLIESRGKGNPLAADLQEQINDLIGGYGAAQAEFEAHWQPRINQARALEARLSTLANQESNAAMIRNRQIRETADPAIDEEIRRLDRRRQELVESRPKGIPADPQELAALRETVAHQRRELEQAGANLDRQKQADRLRTEINASEARLQELETKERRRHDIDAELAEINQQILALQWRINHDWRAVAF